MDAETVKFITTQNHELKEDLKEYIQAAMSLNRAKIINELDPIRSCQEEIVEQNKIRNGRLETLENETKWFRLIHNNPGKTLITIVVLIAAISLGASKVHVAHTVKNIFGLEMKADDTPR